MHAPLDTGGMPGGSLHENPYFLYTTESMHGRGTATAVWQRYEGSSRLTTVQLPSLTNDIQPLKHTQLCLRLVGVYGSTLPVS